MTQDLHLDKVLETVRTYGEEELPAAILESADWCHLYHLSRARTNLIEWIPIGENEDVLEVGSECGALTGLIGERAHTVTALEIDAVKTEINRTRHSTATNITYLQGSLAALANAKPNQKYDKIFAIGSLPLAELYTGQPAEKAYVEFLTTLKASLKPQGRLVLALPNRFGLKYFAGCREDYFGAPFTGLEDYYYHKGMKTFGHRELTELLTRSGFPDAKFYYPYPDYRFMGSLYSDDYLPRAGELNRNLECFDQDRYVFFDEAKVFGSVLSEGLFPELTNSFLVITGTESVSTLVFTKYSAERDERFALRTDIVKSDGRLTARKTALNQASQSHVKHIAAAARRLEALYAGSGIGICPSREESDGVSFDYLRGETLQSRLETLVLSGETAEVRKILETYQERVSRAATEPFAMTDAFREVFGDVTLPSGLLATGVSDIDLIFSNILLTESGWQVIDYEWTFDFPVPLHFLLYRAYFFATRQIQRSEALDLAELLKSADISEGEAETYDAMERHFQRYVTGGRMQERDLLTPIGREILPLAAMEQAYRTKKEEKHEKRRFPDLRRNRRNI